MSEWWNRNWSAQEHFRAIAEIENAGAYHHPHITTISKPDPPPDRRIGDRIDPLTGERRRMRRLPEEKQQKHILTL